ncbi:MAG: cupin domain-containing protein [Chloroflexota bacterium]
MSQIVGRGGRPAIVDMTVAQVRDLDPGFCQRLQGLGLTEPVLCGEYLHRTLEELARAEHLDVRMLLAAVGSGPTVQDQPTHTHTAGLREWPGPRLAASTAHLNLADEIEQLRAEPAWKEFDRNAKTLVKNPELRVVLLALKSGARLEQHWAAGPITIQALAGWLRVHLPEHTLDMQAGELAAIAQATRHDVEALEPSVFLLTIAALPAASSEPQDHHKGEAIT